MHKAFAEGSQICEVKPKWNCLERTQVENKIFNLPITTSGLARDGITICDSTFQYITAPDVILIMDNTGSMAKVRTVDNIPRYCDIPPNPINYTKDPGCISGDPDTLRAKALQAFLDSAVVKGGGGTRVAVILFNYRVTNDPTWNLLTAGTVQAIKNELVVDASDETNYYAAFSRALKLLEEGSTKTRDEQVIIFVSDGKPSLPERNEGGPFAYQSFIDQKRIPVVHSIFLGESGQNSQELQKISQQTGGLFFAIRDVSKMASLLTDSIAKQVFKRAKPVSSTVQNQNTKAAFNISTAHHFPNADTSAFNLQLPSSLYLAKGKNKIVVRTQYGTGTPASEISFSFDRNEGLDSSLFSLQCRDLARLDFLNSQGQSFGQVGGHYDLTDSVARFKLTTTANLDRYPVSLEVRRPGAARADYDTVQVAPPLPRESSIPFRHQITEKNAGNGKLEADQGEDVLAVYRNPGNPEDTATSQVRISYGPQVVSAYFEDSNQDGLVDRVRIFLLEAINTVPASLRFRMRDGSTGQQVERLAQFKEGEITFGKNANGGTRQSLIIVQLNKPFPKGATSVENADQSGHFFRQVEIPTVDADFRVDDSVAPVIVKAQLLETDRSHAQRRILVTYSEAVKLSENALRPIVFKRDTLSVNPEKVPIHHIEKISDREYEFSLQPGSEFALVGGDSIAIDSNGETTDAYHRYPRARIYFVLEGLTPEQAINDVFVTFGDGNRSNPKLYGNWDTPSLPGIVPVDSVGEPLQGASSLGKCGSCNVGSQNNFQGSVINFQTPAPVAYELSIFTNLGEFVFRFKGEVEEKDLALLNRKYVGDGASRRPLYTQRLVWNGATLEGRPAHTGAYILRAVFHFEKNLNTGAPAKTEAKLTRFGFIRNCCPSPNAWKSF